MAGMVSLLSALMEWVPLRCPDRVRGERIFTDEITNQVEMYLPPGGHTGGKLEENERADL